MTPLALWRALFMPTTASWQGDDARYVDTFLFFTLTSFFVGIYSLFKWYEHDHSALVMTSVLLVSLECLAGVIFRFSRQPVVALNVGFLGMVIHAVNIIYQTGGIVESTQAFWSPLLIVAFYLSARLLMATVWSLLVVVVSGWMVNSHLSGRVFPNVELSSTSQMIETWSGFLLPLVVIVIAQAWASRQRHQAIAQAETAHKSSEAIAEQAKLGASQLAEVLDKASGNAESLTQVSNVIEQQSSELHQQVGALNVNCESQASAAEQMSEQVKHLTLGMEASDQFVTELKQRSDIIYRQAETSSESLQASKQAIARILSSNDEIMSVADVITSVAEQTNLLALNAAIEAARAGEQGRGFAVVADQVRELSAKSNSSAVDIRALLERSRREVSQGQAVIESSTAELSGIIEQVSSVSGDVTQLADTISQQVEALRELTCASQAVASSVVETNQVSDAVASQGALLAEQVERLNTLAESLNQVVGLRQQRA
ncbi:chemotaxis protein [Photobacterium gaetbulicola]|uniref:Chemotaxis protein n=1 Tax=Photobacterium gaetbulicola TaxID=1295392 RepID=A0A0B9G861_9GAMM|nr:methyl-accepting chemotaxis protein [Photobacterium gaetbulicola]KHT64754.1 chemotaxis protein [Photobacterium gaetbulicola]